jgi:LuxR family maltose regulon positive regulatory protein
MAGAAGASVAGAFAPPALARHAIDRPDLVARLDAAARGALTVVCAPPGYGKATLLAQWAHACAKRVVWIRFRPDQDARSVAGFLVGAIGSLGADMQPNADEHARILGRQLLPFLVDRLHTVTDACIVFECLDNLAPEMRAHIGTLIEDAPRHVHFIVLTRVSGLFPATAARLLVRDDLVNFGADDLAFDRANTRDLLEAEIGGPVLSDTVEALARQTGGWPAAIKFAILAARNHPDLEAAMPVFDGSDPSFRAYCGSWLLDDQPAPVRAFLTTMSVVDRFTAELAAALTHRPDAVEMLELVDHLGVLVLDPERGWWRYRTPVRDLLRAELHTADVDAEAHVLHAAAQWHVEQGADADLEAAARYLIRARDWQGVLAHVQAHAHTMHVHGKVGAVLAWMLAVPERVRRADIAATLTEAALHTLTGDTYAAAATLRALGEFDSLAPPERLAVQSIRQVWLFGHLSPGETIEVTEDVTRLLDESSGELRYPMGLLTREQTRQNAGGMRALAEYVLGRPYAARRAVDPAHVSDDTYALSSLQRQGVLAMIEAQYGSLTRALEHVAEARRIAALALLANHPFLMFAELAEAHVLIERDEQLRAHHALDRAEQLISAFTFEIPARWHAMERAHLALIEGATRELLPLLDAEVADTERLRLVEAQRRVLSARVLYVLDDLEFAKQRLGYHERTLFPEVAGAAVQLALASGDLAAAARIVAHWPVNGELQSDLSRGLWTAAIEFANGALDPACARASGVLTRARAEGHVRMFLDAGVNVHRLLVAVSQREPTTYLTSLLRKHRSLGTPAGNQPALSPRERSVLACLADRMTYGEIAERLFISQNTVKTHAKSVYMKLGVGSRREAIERADELGLL